MEGAEKLSKEGARLITVNLYYPQKRWDVARRLHLKPLELYKLILEAKVPYQCIFNQGLGVHIHIYNIRIPQIRGTNTYLSVWDPALKVCSVTFSLDDKEESNKTHVPSA